MIIIHEAVDKTRAAAFLKDVHSLFALGNYKIVQRDKNDEFDEEFELTDAQKRKMLLQLTADDCVEIGWNTNPDYPEAEIYKFIKSYPIEEKWIEVYFKMYKREFNWYDLVIFISFHEAGKY